MARNRKTAKAAGAGFEMCVADTMSHLLGDQSIRRAFTKGAMDMGDIEGVRHHGKDVVIECKNEKSVKLSPWWIEATREAHNVGTDLCVIAHKRKRVSWASSGKKINENHWITAPASMMVKFGLEESDITPINRSTGTNVLDLAGQHIDGASIAVSYTRNGFPDDPWVTTTMKYFARLLAHDIASFDVALIFRGDDLEQHGTLTEWHKQQLQALLDRG